MKKKNRWKRQKFISITVLLSGIALIVAAVLISAAVAGKRVAKQAESVESAVEEDADVTLEDGNEAAAPDREDSDDLTGEGGTAAMMPEEEIAAGTGTDAEGSEYADEEGADDTDGQIVTDSSEDELAAEADRIVSQMSEDEKLCQMFFITPEQLTGADTVTAAGDATKSAYEKKPVGGLIYFAKNLTDPDQTKKMLANTLQYAQDISGLPVFLGVDEEGGRIARVAENSTFGVTKVGAACDMKTEEEAGNAGLTIGTYLSELGFNVDFAPDADVLTNPENKVISDRSFGSDSGTVQKLAKAYSDGLHEAGIRSCYKHFPGHGGTGGDTHDGFAASDRTAEELRAQELVPFQNAASDGAEFVMAAHISLPKILSDNTPCSLSEEMLTGILRQECGYEGIIITDALNMGAISKNYGAGEAAVMAVEAGADMLLMPADFQAAYEALGQAVESGRITQDRVDASVKRIVLAKLKMRQS
ncbi:MAG: glycoside hydrolase family 3 protein [Lachnospiraceae bacterium]|nr:glycoside hydrolase family 3 protein [Lachnospiraceae bacterium]